MKIFYDSLQEGAWFQELNPSLTSADLFPFPPLKECPNYLKQTLLYDRPDIVLVDDNIPILVLERTVEVPSGHNVGQRFARLVAAAQLHIPVVYFGPYAAYKHGGKTQGPRFMNLRLFYALERMANVEGTAITTINWPVDDRYEIIYGPEKDTRVRQYLELFFNLYYTVGLGQIQKELMNSSFEREQSQERKNFVREKVVRAEQYEQPPESVKIAPWRSIGELALAHPNNLSKEQTVFYKVGMRYIRSDPYTGMSLLYSYLYCGGITNRYADLVLYFPMITKEMWQITSRNGERKDIRLYRIASDGILFSDGYLPKENL